MVFMVFMFVLGFGLVAVAFVHMKGGSEPGDDTGGGDDGPPRRGRGPRRPRPSGSDPRWWPDFEREFRIYASKQEPRRKVTGVT
jgi:hypothetical protein